MRKKRWVFASADREAGALLARALGLSPLTGTLLVNRGVRDPGEARRFLKPDLSELADPLRFRDMGRAVDRLEAAVKRREKVALFGDYDVDGTAGTAILFKILSLLGVPVCYRVPHRVTDGYGLNPGAVEGFAGEGATLLVAVDCGTVDREEIDLARSRGLDVIVVDHHEPEGDPPAGALAVLNPKVEGAGYGYTGLCAAGIAFKLAWALADRTVARRKEGFEGFILDAMGLAALGTVADVCPLLGENRVLVRYGLDALRACRGRGLKALLDKAGLGDKPLETFDLGFKLAPRLNALGRLGSAMDCVDLLVTEDEGRIETILKRLEKSNRNRKDIEDEIFAQACARVEEEGAEGAIVVADERWHPGVVGIVAARLVDRYYLPSFVLSVGEGVARGSARSIEGFALHEALESCGDLLLTRGGHAMAAGLSLRQENLPAFRERMRLRVARGLPGELLGPKLALDEDVPLSAITAPVVREVARLAPHGPGNPEPILAASRVRVAGEPRLMGKRSDHLSLFLSQEGVSVRAVGFGMGDLLEPLRKAELVSVAFTPRINSWMGKESVELHLKDVKTGS
jgi:single-stranded-DNA-specific exonuclease